MTHRPEAPAVPAPSRDLAPRFLTGSLFRHVFVMASTAAIGLVAVFAVDLINLFYISRLGEKEIAAAIGFAGVVGFFQISLAIGLTIGITAVVSRKIGAGQRDEARRLAVHSLLLMTAICAVVGSGSVPFLHPMLRALGASGETERLAARYLAITVHSLPLLGLGMAAAALLRAAGDARRAMNVTLSAAFVTAALDPVLIFGAGLGLDGAAIAALVSRCVLAGVGLYGVMRVHRMLGPVERRWLARDARALATVAGPAVLTNFATPVAAAFVTHSIAQFGASAVAGQAIVDRVTPVAFGLVYALSGAVGPVLAQNLGARQYDRVRQGFRDSLVFMVLAVGVAWGGLALGQGLIVRAFSAEGQAAQLIHAFCTWLAPGFFFIGALFVAQAAFNNLGRPLWSTGLNWARATLGTIPFAWWGSRYGPVGVVAGQMLGAVVFGSLSMWFAFRLMRGLGRHTGTATPATSPTPQVPEAGCVPLPQAAEAGALAPLVHVETRH
ncbi:MATE family efflux transporter [Pseudorhodoferax soli]|uniref:Putative MATE family efflux protein n=1 Tax=Pseudorhodoferax soli TaxID=545864 RepID=A0A368Y789_9BURK|nr:MATE family efflux transporter [Pseudorhodoferax soli]RCW76150.1 putative MATE family efflux protein [Pseudorhodoferax soli]